METRWTEFQRSCVQHIAGLLGSIRGLVGTLGPDALGNYCQHGCLGKQCLDRVNLAGFSKPDKDEESGDEESGDEESGDEEMGDEEMEDEEMGDEEVGDEESEDEESGDEGTEYEDEESENADDESEDEA